MKPVVYLQLIRDSSNLIFMLFFVTLATWRIYKKDYPFAVFNVLLALPSIIALGIEYSGLIVKVDGVFQAIVTLARLVK